MGTIIIIALVTLYLIRLFVVDQIDRKLKQSGLDKCRFSTIFVLTVWTYDQYLRWEDLG